jgi:hypothetical protein
MPFVATAFVVLYLVHVVAVVVFVISTIACLLVVASNGPRWGAAVDKSWVRAQVGGGHGGAVMAGAVFDHGREGVLGAAHEHYGGAALVRLQQIAWSAAFVLELEEDVEE